MGEKHKTTIRVVNEEKQTERNRKKNEAAKGKAAALQKYEAARTRLQESQAKKGELQEQIAATIDEKAKAALQTELDGLDQDIKNDLTEMQNAGKEVTKFTKEEEDADKEDVTEEQEVEGDSRDRDNPQPSTETKYQSDLIAALLAGTHISDSPDPLDLTLNVGLRATEAVVGYKSSGYGRIGFVCDAEIKDWPIYRIRKNVMIGEKVPNIVKSRRAGVEKDSKTKWTVADIEEVRGIAIAVPPGYSGKVEDLVIPIPKLSAVAKEELRLKGKPVPRQPDVQLLIEWKEKDKDGRVLSWENRSGCRTLWKKNGDQALLDAATHFEGHYRNAGGKHQSEEPFQIPSVGSSLSPESTPDPEQAASTRTTPETTPEPGTTGQSDSDKSKKVDSTATDKAAERADFKNDWCEDKGIDPEKMTDKQDGHMRAAFKVYWEDLNKAASED